VGVAPSRNKLALRKKLTNLHFKSQFLALIFSEITATIRTERREKWRTWLDRLGKWSWSRIYILYRVPVTYFQTKLVYPFTLRVNISYCFKVINFGDKKLVSQPIVHWITFVKLLLHTFVRKIIR